MRITLLFLLSGLLLLGNSTAALAGFQWAPPSNRAPASAPAPKAQAEQPFMLQSEDDLSGLPTVESAPLAPAPFMIERQNLQPSPLPPREQQAMQQQSQPAPQQPQMAQESQSGAPISLLKANQPDPETAPQYAPRPQIQVIRQLEPGRSDAETETGSAPQVQETAPHQGEEPLKITTITRRAQTRKEPEVRTSPATVPYAKPAITLLAKLPEEAPQDSFAPISGFGTDLPLAIALGQIVPPQYGYVPMGNIDLGKRVSWNGEGRPWNIVLDDMLRPEGLESEVQGNKVLLQRIGTRHQRATAIVDTTVIDGTAAQKTIAAPPSSPETPPTTLTITTEPTEAKQKLAEVPPAPAQPRMASTAPSYNAPSYNKGERLWQAAQGESLRTILTAWSQRAGFALVWQSPKDFNVNSDILVTGSFENALDILMNYGVGKSAPSYTIKQTGDNANPGVIVVQG